MENDLISRSAALKVLRDHSCSDLEYYSEYEDFKSDIEQLPAIDAVPVVRCKDCENTDSAVGLPEGMFYCNEWESTTRSHWYCCRGEKKEET